jgi:hypothetical protein
MASKGSAPGSPRSKRDAAVDPLAKELSLLAAQKAAAIDDCDFAKVREIDCHCDRLKEELAFAKSKASHVESQFVLDLKKEAIRVKAAAALQKARDEVFKMKAAFQDRLIELYGIHTRELEALADRYRESVELELMRRVPNSIQLKKQAQFSAKNRDYSLADILSQESNEAWKKQIEKKREEMKQLFHSKRERMKARHGQDREAVDAKLERDIEMIQYRFNAKMDRYKASLFKTAVDLGVTMGEEDLAFLGEFRLKDQLKSPSGSPKGSESGSGSRPSTPLSASRSTPPQSPTLT